MEWFDVDTWKTTWTTFTTSNNASRGHIASSRPMLTKGCCKGNNYEQRFALDTFPADFSWRNILAKPCILLFTWQQDCNTREACRLLLVVKVVFVVFPNSAGRIGNSTNPITRFSGWTFYILSTRDDIYSIYYLFLRFPLPPLTCCGLRSSRALSAKTKSSWRRSRLACATRMRTGSPSW